jgi:hypothetical protein
MTREVLSDVNDEQQPAAQSSEEWLAWRLIEDFCEFGSSQIVGREIEEGRKN